MAEYGGWVTLGDSSPKPPETSGSWLKPIHLTKSELLRRSRLLAYVPCPVYYWGQLQQAFKRQRQPWTWGCGDRVAIVGGFPLGGIGLAVAHCPSPERAQALPSADVTKPHCAAPKSSWPASAPSTGFWPSLLTCPRTGISGGWLGTPITVSTGWGFWSRTWAAPKTGPGDGVSQMRLSRSALERNLYSAIRLSREVIPHMKQQHWGRIINLLSSSSQEFVDGTALSSLSQLAIMGFFRALASELAPFNITVNNVVSGPVETELFRSRIEERAEAEGQPASALMQKAVKTHSPGPPGPS